VDDDRTIIKEEPAGAISGHETNVICVDSPSASEESQMRADDNDDDLSIRRTPPMSEKAKGKQRAVTDDSPAPETRQEMDGQEAGPDKGEAELKRKRDGVESTGDKQEPQDRPAKRAKADPPTEAPRDVGACPRCIKQGRPCINEPGRACQQCNKSKVKCPLFNGQ
jgi:hypothetical protein